MWLVASVWYYDCKIKRVCGPQAISAQVQAPVFIDSSEATIAAPPTEPPDMPTDMPTAATNRPAATVTLTVYFDQKSAELVLPTDADDTLAVLRQAIAAGKHLAITGYSDDRGERRRIAIVAQQRAQAMRGWLLTQGIAAADIATVQSHEDREPIADNNTAAGRAQNRRAVATLE